VIQKDAEIFKLSKKFIAVKNEGLINIEEQQNLKIFDISL